MSIPRWLFRTYTPPGFGSTMEREKPYPTPATPTSYCGERTDAHPDYEPRSVRFSRALGAATLYATLYGASIASSDIALGIQEGKDRVAHDHAELHSIYAYAEDHPSFSSHATIVLTGLGTKDASDTAKTLAAHRDVGSVYAIEYGNKDLNTKDIAERIAQRLEEDTITHVSFDGYSMGGPIALDIASQLHRNHEELEVVSIILNSSPVGEGGLTERSKQSIQALERVLSLHGDLVYYEHGRTLIELLARSEHFMNVVGEDSSTGFISRGLDEYSYDGVRYHVDYSALRKELASIQEKMSQPNVADANLIYNQARILKLNFSEQLEEISDDTLVVYTRSRSASGDTVVDVEASEQNVIKALIEHDQPYRVLHAPVQHANPTERQAEYDRMIRNKIQPELIYYMHAQGSDIGPQQPTK